MKQPPTEILSLMAVAAELRAAGSPWEAVAQKVLRSPRTCRSWSERYPHDWQRLYCAAEDKLLAEAAAEAMHFLRRLLRSKDEWILQNTAKFLVSERREARSRQDAAATDADNRDSDWSPFLAHLETLSDAQLQAFLDDFVARRLAQASPALLAGSGGSSPPVAE
jgi:hypothetical protein